MVSKLQIWPEKEATKFLLQPQHQYIILFDFNFRKWENI